MAKQANELDLSTVKRKILNKTTKQSWDKIFSSLTPSQTKYLNILSSNKSVNCHIFSGSIAFRIGKSSVKSLQDYPMGLKGGIPSGKTATDIFINTPHSSTMQVTKDKFVLVAAYYFLYNHFDRVKTESDKTEAAETEQVIKTQDKLKEVIKEFGEIRLKIGDNLYQVDKFEQVSGRPKADAVFSFKGTPVIFVSLKKGSKPANFQQYGGLTDLQITGSNASEYPDITKFMQQIDKIFNAFDVKKNEAGKYDFNVFEKGAYFGQLVTDPMTGCKVIFGKDFATNANGNKVFGLNNCNVTIDGDIVFTKVGKTLNTYELGGQYHVSINPYETKPVRLPVFNENDMYSPVLFLAKSESQGLSQLGYDNVRFNIWPKNEAASKGISNLNELMLAINSGNKRKISELKGKYLK